MTLGFGHGVAWYDEGVYGWQLGVDEVYALLHLFCEVGKGHFCGGSVAHETPSHGKEVALQMLYVCLLVCHAVVVRVFVLCLSHESFQQTEM